MKMHDFEGILNYTGYQLVTNYWNEITAIDRNFEAVKQKVDEILNSNADYRQLTELVMVINHKSWELSDNKDYKLSDKYSKLFYKLQNKVLKKLNREEQLYYFRITD